MKPLTRSRHDSNTAPTRIIHLGRGMGTSSTVQMTPMIEDAQMTPELIASHSAYNGMRYGPASLRRLMAPAAGKAASISPATASDRQ